MLIQAQFSYQSSGCHWESGARLVSHISVATSESTNSSPNCTDINCFGSVKIHHKSVNVNWCNFCVEELNNASLPLTDVHDMSCFLRLSQSTFATERLKFQVISVKVQL